MHLAFQLFSHNKPILQQFKYRVTFKNRLCACRRNIFIKYSCVLSKATTRNLSAQFIIIAHSLKIVLKLYQNSVCAILCYYCGTILWIKTILLNWSKSISSFPYYYYILNRSKIFRFINFLGTIYVYLTYGIIINCKPSKRKTFLFFCYFILFHQKSSCLLRQHMWHDQEAWVGCRRYWFWDIGKNSGQIPLFYIVFSIDQFFVTLQPDIQL